MLAFAINVFSLLVFGTFELIANDTEHKSFNYFILGYFVTNLIEQIILCTIFRHMCETNNSNQLNESY